MVLMKIELIMKKMIVLQGNESRKRKITIHI